ncbi:MAG: phenylalanine--tRNA ligase subunit beta [Candidatus Hodarchaeota archaeon]
MNVDVRLSDLLQLIGKDLSPDTLEEQLFLLKCEIDQIVNNIATIEVNPDRVDMLSTEGIARALRGFLNIDLGAPSYPVKKTKWQAIVDSSVEKIRPYLACAIVRNIKLDDELIAELMQLQERLTGTFGRNRKRASIGLYALDLITPPIQYKTAPPNQIRFTPLEHDQVMTAKQILREHPKGQEFGPIIQRYPQYPVLIDAKNQVLSLPPIINSNDLGRVVETTANLFVEVTGTHKLTTLQSLNIMIAALADRGGALADVEVVYPNYSERLPDLSLQQREVSLDYIRRMIGYDFDKATVQQALARMRINSTVQANVVKVRIPAYRVDILHDVDIVEDIAIGYGFDRIEPTMPKTMTVGEELPQSRFLRIIRDLMIGLGYQEIRNYALTNKRVLFEQMNLPAKGAVEVANPKSMEYHLVRNSLLPGILDFLSENTAQELPHRVFEAGDVVLIDSKAETCTRTVLHLAAATVSSRVDITSLKAELMTLLTNLGLVGKVTSTTHPSFIDGRVGSLFVERKKIGYLGEVHPVVLHNFGIEAPCVAFELNVLEDWITSSTKG